MIPVLKQFDESFFDEEVRNDYRISSKTKKLWAVELDLLNQVDLVCKANQINYYACAGTLLGAVRHGGMIPWDDDIDIMMTRENYNRLCSVSHMFSYPYFFQTEYTDPGSLRGHAQLRNSKTTGIISYELEGQFAFNQGIFIDIFPLDYLPDNSKDRELFLKKADRLRWIARMYRDIPAHPDASDSKIKNTLRHMLSPLLRSMNDVFHASQKAYKNYEKHITSFLKEPTSTLGIVALHLNDERFIWDSSDFCGQIQMFPFEDMCVPVPPGYLNILKKTYGNWREMVRNPSGHGGIIYRIDVSYQQYLETKAKKS